MPQVYIGNNEVRKSTTWIKSENFMSNNLPATKRPKNVPQKGWEPTFLIRGIGLSEKHIISFGFVFSDICLKSQNLKLKPNFFLVFLF